MLTRKVQFAPEDQKNVKTVERYNQNIRNGDRVNNGFERPKKGEEIESLIPPIESLTNNQRMPIKKQLERLKNDMNKLKIEYESELKRLQNSNTESNTQLKAINPNHSSWELIQSSRQSRVTKREYLKKQYESKINKLKKKENNILKNRTLYSKISNRFKSLPKGLKNLWTKTKKRFGKNEYTITLPIDQAAPAAEAEQATQAAPAAPAAQAATAAPAPAPNQPNILPEQRQISSNEIFKILSGTAKTGTKRINRVSSNIGNLTLNKLNGRFNSTHVKRLINAAKHLSPEEYKTIYNQAKLHTTINNIRREPPKNTRLMKTKRIFGISNTPESRVKRRINHLIRDTQKTNPSFKPHQETGKLYSKVKPTKMQ